MRDLLLTLLALQVVIPLGLLTWLAFGRHGSQAGWVLAFVLTACYLVAIAAAGMWLMIPPALPWVYLALLPLALARSWRSVRPTSPWPGTRQGWLGIALRSTLGFAAAALAAYAVSGRRTPSEPAVDLAFPLAGDGYYVANGGSTALVNAHLMTLAGERFRAYRGQSYGVDIVRLGRWGMRARGLLPSDPRAYAIFGAPLLAPCAGVVLRAEDGLADLSPPVVDRAHMAGNHVILDCGTAWVVLGHLRQGSVSVSAGDSVRIGQQLGNVGNTGNTDEPHLHIHGQRPGTDAEPLSGDPLPIRFAGRHLVRNARVSGVRGTASPEGSP
jgi:hypothetical protein